MLNFRNSNVKQYHCQEITNTSKESKQDNQLKEIEIGESYNENLQIENQENVNNSNTVQNNGIFINNIYLEDLYEFMLSKQSVFDNSKETLSLMHNSKLSSSIRSKSSLVMETEKAKIEQSTKTLDILIKSTQERSMKRNLVRETTNRRKSKDPSQNEKEETSNPPMSMEIEESLDLGKYQVAGMKDYANNASVKYSEEDTPRRIPPTPEPNNKDQKVKVPELELYKVPSMLKSLYRVSNPEYPIGSHDPILVHHEFSEENIDFKEEHKELKEVTYTNERNINIDLKYPFRKETSNLMNTLDEVKEQAKLKVITNRRHNIKKMAGNKSQVLLKPMRSVENALKSKLKQQDSRSAISKNSTSQSRLRQPTPTSLTSRKSLESVRTNLMASHYHTMRETGGRLKTSRNS